MIVVELALLLATTMMMAIALPVNAPIVRHRHQTKTLMSLLLNINSEIGEFSTLIMGLGLTGLYGVLEDTSYFTLLAPTDAAFAKLGLTTENIDTLPVSVLTRLLRHHISSGNRYSGSIMTTAEMRMLDGQPTRISLVDSDTYVDHAQIIAMDIDAGNGVLHIVDTVLLP